MASQEPQQPGHGFGLADQLYTDALKRRVVVAALLCGFCALATQAAMYYIQTEVSSDLIVAALQLLRASAAEEGRPAREAPPPNFVGMVLGVGFSLAVLSLGYCGAARENNVCVLSYIFGSLCSLLGGCCMTCILLIALLTLGLFVPAAETHFRECDASVLCPLTEPPNSTYDLPDDLVIDKRSVDCLAASVWREQYERRYPDFGEVLPEDCPSIVFLNCSLLDSNLSSLHAGLHRRVRAESWMSLVTDLLHPRSRTFRRLSSAFSSCMVHLSQAGELLGRSAQQSDAPEPTDERAPSPSHRDEDYAPPPMPPDPLTSCFADRGAMDVFHDVALRLPDVWGSLFRVYWLGIFTGTSSVLLAFFSSLWGTQLRAALNRKAVAHATMSRQSQVMELT